MQEVITTHTYGGSERIDGHREIEGVIFAPRGVVRQLIGDEFLLALEDGRRLRFIFRNEDGGIKALGGFESDPQT
jgi:hypothetical protein